MLVNLRLDRARGRAVRRPEGVRRSRLLHAAGDFPDRGASSAGWSPAAAATCPEQSTEGARNACLPSPAAEPAAQVRVAADDADPRNTEPTRRPRLPAHAPRRGRGAALVVALLDGGCRKPSPPAPPSLPPGLPATLLERRPTSWPSDTAAWPSPGPARSGRTGAASTAARPPPPRSSAASSAAATAPCERPSRPSPRYALSNRERLIHDWRRTGQPCQPCRNYIPFHIHCRSLRGPHRGYT